MFKKIIIITVLLTSFLIIFVYFFKSKTLENQNEEYIKTEYHEKPSIKSESVITDNYRVTFDKYIQDKVVQVVFKKSKNIEISKNDNYSFAEAGEVLFYFNNYNIENTEFQISGMVGIVDTRQNPNYVEKIMLGDKSVLVFDDKFNFGIGGELINNPSITKSYQWEIDNSYTAGMSCTFFQDKKEFATKLCEEIINDLIIYIE